MCFIDEYGHSLINSEHKLWVPLSERAIFVISEDMAVFSVDQESTFINTVFANFRGEAKSSVCLYLEQKKEVLNRLFPVAKLKKAKGIAIEQLLLAEEKELRNKVMQYRDARANGRKLYYINKENVGYLEKECIEDQYYNIKEYKNEKPYYSGPAEYVRSVIEEYCSLPFIKRERIYRKKEYDIVERACKEKTILQVDANYQGKEQTFYVYPYKIVPDSFHTQSYLVCYSRMPEEDEDEKKIVSFSMARINPGQECKGNFSLKKQEIKDIENRIAKDAAAYLVGGNEEIKVQLTKKGERSYRQRLYSRPEKTGIEKIETDKTDDQGNHIEESIYTFNCTQQQIFNYFFSFGAEAKIISPEGLRNRFQNTYERALAVYDSDTTE
jgi:hypothetical protein